MAAVTVYSVAGLSGLGGRLLLGVAGRPLRRQAGADRRPGRAGVAIATYLVGRAARRILALSRRVRPAYGGVMPLYAVLAREYFGARIMGTVFGAVDGLRQHRHGDRPAGRRLGVRQFRSIHLAVHRLVRDRARGRRGGAELSDQTQPDTRPWPRCGLKSIIPEAGEYYVPEANLNVRPHTSAEPFGGGYDHLEDAGCDGNHLDDERGSAQSFTRRRPGRKPARGPGRRPSVTVSPMRRTFPRQPWERRISSIRGCPPSTARSPASAGVVIKSQNTIPSRRRHGGLVLYSFPDFAQGPDHQRHELIAAAVAGVAENMQRAGRPSPVQLPGRGQRSADVETPVYRTPGMPFSFDASRINWPSSRNRLAPVVRDKPGKSEPELRVVISWVQAGVPASARRVRLPAHQARAAASRTVSSESASMVA